jgi:hypothetical protein
MIESKGLRMFRGPLMAYLTDRLGKAPRKPAEVDHDASWSLLAELKLDDWLEGRSADLSDVIEQYRLLSTSFRCEKSILHRLRQLSPPSEDDRTVDEALTESLVEAFSIGLRPARDDLVAKYPEWARSHIVVPLVYSAAGVGFRLERTIVNILTNPEHATVSAALQQAYPSIGPDLVNAQVDQNSGNLAIHVLSQAGASKLLEQLLRLPGVDINARNEHQDTPLLLACLAGRFSAAMVLIENGADVSLRNIYQENVLHWMHSFDLFPGQIRDLATAILARGTRELLTAVAESRPCMMDLPEHPYSEGTPIHRAIIKGSDEAALCLWELECQMFAPHRPAYGPIILAAQLHSHRLLDAFLEGPSDLVDPKGFSLLLHMGMGSVSGSSVGRLLRHGVKCRQSGISMLKTLCKYGITDNFANVPGLPECNILSLAWEKAPPEVVEFLLREMDCAKFVNVDTLPWGIAPAVFRGESVKYGIESWKSSLLYTALLCDRPTVFKLLLQHGADVNKIQGSEYGPLTVLHCSVLMSSDPVYIKVTAPITQAVLLQTALG